MQRHLLSVILPVFILFVTCPFFVSSASSCELIGFADENIGDDIKKGALIYNTPCDISGSFSDDQEKDCFNSFAPLENESRRFMSTANVTAALVESRVVGDEFHQLYDVEASVLIGVYEFFEESSTQWYFGVTNSDVAQYKTQKSFRWKLLDSGGFALVGSSVTMKTELLNPEVFPCSSIVPKIDLNFGHKNVEPGAPVIKIASISGAENGLWCGETDIEGNGFCGNFTANMESSGVKTVDPDTPVGTIKGSLKSQPTPETGSAGHPIHRATVELYRQDSEVRAQDDDETADEYIRFLAGEGRSLVETVNVTPEDLPVFQFDNVPLFEAVPTDGSAPIGLLYTVQVTNAATELVESDDPELVNDFEAEYFDHALPNVTPEISARFHTIVLQLVESYVVNSFGDDRDENPSNGICGTGNTITRDGKQEPECTLRAAIDESNWNLGPDRITFNIPGPAPHTIDLKSGLPAITDPLTIDGASQPPEGSGGAGLNSVGPGNATPNRPKIVLDGLIAGKADGLKITGGKSTISGLSIINFSGNGNPVNRDSSGNGVLITDKGGNRIEGNFIGVDPAGSGQANDGNGIMILSGNNTIGGIASAPGKTPGNVISGNLGVGIKIKKENGNNNKVMGNLIGTNITGDDKLPNNLHGVYIHNANGNIIGGSEQGASNVISGNAKNGIVVATNKGNDNSIFGNFIGVDKTGSGALGNSESGIMFGGEGITTVGGIEEGEGNVISGNGKHGIWAAAIGSKITGNIIGLDKSGANKTGNSEDGINLDFHSRSILIKDNLISGNLSNGVYLAGEDTIAHGNVIGLTSSEEKAGNGLNAVLVAGRAQNNSIGGVKTGEGNTIISKNRSGVAITGFQTYGISVLSNNIEVVDRIGPKAIGIDLGNDGATLNDKQDSDRGPNDKLNFPGIDSAKIVNFGDDLEIRGVMQGSVGETYTIQLFKSECVKDLSYTFIGQTTSAEADVTGEASFFFTAAGSIIDTGDFVSATATDLDGSTSELLFPCVKVVEE